MKVMNVCRLCGLEKSSLDFNAELNDRSCFNSSYFELVENYCRIQLSSNKLLPQGICEDCRIILETFAEFSQKLQDVQNNFSETNSGDFETVGVKESFDELQLYPETVIKQQEESEDESNSDSEEESQVSNQKQKKNRLEDSLSFEEVFQSELTKTSITKFVLHLNVPESAKLSEGEVPESALVNIDPTRWSHMVKNCEVCNAPIKNLIEFNSHQETTHNTKTAHVPCKLCPNSFKKVFSYINHVLNKHLHLEHLRFCCLLCDSMFFSLAHLYHHVKNYHPVDQRRVFQCIICGHHSESLSLLKKHKRIHDYDEENEEIAKIYSNLKSVGHKITLRIENRFKNEDGTVAAGKEKEFLNWSDYKMSCALCSAVELTPIDYFLHHQNHHIDWTLPGRNPPPHKFSCKDCPEESFASLVSFCSHQVYKHHHEDLSFRCIVCSKMFWNYVAYSHHLKFSHPSFKQFLCSLCGKMLDRFSIFRHHLTAVHENKRKKKLKSKVPKRAKVETESESDCDESESDYESEISSDDIPLKQKSHERKRRSKAELPKRRPNNRHRTEKQTMFGAELDTPEKLFADEISRNSTLIHLNISVNGFLPNGEVSEELAAAQSLNPLRWRDLLFCAVCKLKFSNIIELTQHISEEHSTRTRAFGCFNCDIEYGALYESSLVNHLVERHYFEHLRFCCLVCSKLFFDFKSLVNHYKFHTEDFEILVCFICGFYAKTLDDLKEHKAYHVQMENSKPENQSLCERVLDKYNKGVEANTFNMEIAEYERNPDGTVTIECQRRFTVDWSFAHYQCPLCFVNLSNPFELFAHLRLKHPKEQDQARKIYSCNTCVEKKEFSGMHYFINHAAEFHFESLRFTCVVCSRLFWNYLALANHYKNVHPSFTSVFCCHCGKLFHSITSAAIHYKKIMIMLTEEEKKLKKEGKLETEEANHICHVCGKCCKNNYTLVKHITTHEVPDPAKMLQCNICQKLFNTKNKLTQHMVGHNNLRKWKCKTCGMSFNFKKLLQMHTRAVHENERSFACTFCEKKFFKKYDLTVHVRLHTGEFPYACPVSECDAKYPAWSNLFKHCQSRHKLDIRSEGYKKLRAAEKPANDNYGSE